MVKSNDDYGITALYVQTKRIPQFVFALDATISRAAPYGFEDSQYERFNDGHRLFGFWGLVDPYTYKLNALGYVK